MESKRWTPRRHAVGGLFVFLLLAVFAVAMAYLVKGTYNPFIYFNF